MPVVDQFYQDMLENAKNYNKRLCIERRQRLPFLDSQTGVAQNHCNLWIPYKYRGPGLRHGQLYTYPSRRWKKKCTLPLPDFSLGPVPKIKLADEAGDVENVGANNVDQPSSLNHNNSANNLIPNNENDAMIVATTSMSSTTNEDSTSNPQQQIDWEDQIDAVEMVENDRQNSDSSDYEETYIKKRGKKGGRGGDRSKAGALKDPTFRGPKAQRGAGGGKGRVKKEKDPTADALTDKDKPYVCELCPMRYKTRPGLSYHMNHTHNKAVPTDDEDLHIHHKPETTYSRKQQQQQQQQQQQHHHHQHPQQQPPFPLHQHPTPPQQQQQQQFHHLHQQQHPQHHHQQQQQHHQVMGPPMLSSSSSSSSSSSVLMNMPSHALPKPGSKYCDFCLGDEMENKKTGLKEEMVSCADCGRSGHPSCLQFSPNMIISVKRYPWQCIECKSCGICGTSDNDDQLLFCDDCDRGYHMYCLKPPLSEPPEGSWSCHLCVVEFYNSNKQENVAN